MNFEESIAPSFGKTDIRYIAIVVNGLIVTLLLLFLGVMARLSPEDIQRKHRFYNFRTQGNHGS
jgi:hypothetical protein